MAMLWLRWASGGLALLLGAVGWLSAAEGTGSPTLANLQAAYQDDAKAKTRYEAFAVTADAEGYKGAACLFRAAALSRKIQATKHASAITKLGAKPTVTQEPVEARSTRENLALARRDEMAASDTMYPAFIKQAKADRDTAAARSFKVALASTASRVPLYQRALEELDSWKVARAVLVCRVCGYATLGKGPRKCPVCDAPRSEFEAFE